MTVLERVKKLSKKQGLSLQTVAERAGIGKNSIYRWSTKTPSTENLQKVASVLNTSVAFLLGEIDNESLDIAKKEVDIEDQNIIMTYEGKPIPPEDLEIMKRFLNGGTGNDRK
ncbi:Putative prophage lcu4 transcriptional regulator, Xre family [Latilactobacillus curvatus]|uniref:helix-turn-helix domain-containing protein n=1 Tax=Latilactobacillus curvatus TaxID=28038 RepID=UPI000A1A74F2|nr:helix-turn-helix transcriptional regulator [Latilactobacillus curvatus]SMH69031.1 Putative prophage lcu4 transcriptional regulator, Xre family [Latilactobacillus curvatus]